MKWIAESKARAEISFGKTIHEFLIFEYIIVNQPGEPRLIFKWRRVEIWRRCVPRRGLLNGFPTDLMKSITCCKIPQDFLHLKVVAFALCS